MYLTDREIRELLKEMDVSHENEAHPFDPVTQVQPCSIDLRVSDVFWRPSRSRRLWRRLGRRAYAVDLRHSEAHDLDPLRDWKRYELAEGETLTIKPGRMVMGRIYERFRVPPSFAGKIEGRSSFARLGLSVHCTGDFINPGWQGFMPLQLFNAGPYPIRITPYLPICQLMLIRLPGSPEHSYGDPELQSKYDNDDGGPSKWWRDQSVRELQARLGEVHATERMQREIVDRVRFEDVEVLERFQQFVAERRIGDVENRDQLLEDFANREDRRRLLDRIAIASVPVLLAADLGSLLVPFGIAHVVLGLLTLISVVLALRSYVRRDSGYLGSRELKSSKGVRSERQDGSRAG